MAGPQGIFELSLLLFSLSHISCGNGLCPSTEVDVDVWGSDTIGSLKEVVCRTFELDPNAAFLCYLGHSLDEKTTIAENKIGENSELLLMVTGVVGCVVRGTSVLAANGDYRNVEDLTEGDEVMSWDFERKRNIVGRVL